MIVSPYKKAAAYMIVNPIMSDKFASLFNCTTVSQASDPTKAPSSLCLQKSDT